jgi:hypothetical protein
MAREIRTRTTIETESISVIACRQVFPGGCERSGGEVEGLTAETARTLVEALPKRLQQAGPWGRARNGLVMSLKSLLRFFEIPGTPPHS